MPLKQARKNLYQEDVVKCLLKAPGIELDAINIRGQTAEEVAHNRYMTAEEVAHNRYTGHCGQT